MATATITSKGQVTIPKSVRDRLKIGPGDRLEFIVERNGRVSIVPATVSLRSLVGALRPASRRRVSVEDMNRAIEEEGGKL